MTKKLNDTNPADLTPTLNVQVRNCQVEPELRQHFEEKLDSLQKLWPKTTDADVRVSLERGRYVAEITLASGSLLMRGEERADNLRQAFDCAVEKLQQQLVRYKEKAQARRRRHDNRDDAAGTVLKPTHLASGTILPDDAVLLPAVNGTNGDALAEANGEEKAVRVKRFSLKPMSPDEAALQMDLLGHSFFVFRDADSNQVSVVYHRRSGGYGLIEPVAD